MPADVNEPSATLTTEVRRPPRVLSGAAIDAAAEAVSAALTWHDTVAGAREHAREIAFRAIATYLHTVEQAAS